MAGKAPDWDPDAYDGFADLRLRPVLDLLARIGDLPEGRVIDLGCGTGTAGPELAARFAPRKILGVDSSKAMLKKAGSTGAYKRCDQADIATWEPGKAPALIFSNAALHCLSDHAELLPRLARFLAPGGTLAVQMPLQWYAPSHVLLRELAARMFPARFALEGAPAPVGTARQYWTWLAPLGDITLWETEYLQPLSAEPPAHPVRAFTQATAMRPFLAQMTEAEGAAFTRAYDAALTDAYPLLPDGAALLPLRRLFFVCVRPQSA
ncbi:trans-aconitate methyltransferase [Rhodobacter sp. TJ_12]|uniref:methyltransferase domain-containing protein n=1 Tax=Rhodobacter sp. TJ_12 TaxID=2029399 RepID=UPI001CBD4729|nr:methyltransferase domain-containing protein [Rhodobacter sp. TJ_12]MBZ4023987.1 trans-aconitate methyltransferase [Rhodobacter sp. TJ_12]